MTNINIENACLIRILRLEKSKYLWFWGLIPSRLNSKRLKNKPLLNIDGLPIIVHTFKRAMLSKKLDRVIVCCDDKKILIVKKYGGEAMMTSKNIKMEQREFLK